MQQGSAGIESGGRKPFQEAENVGKLAKETLLKFRSQVLDRLILGFHDPFQVLGLLFEAVDLDLGICELRLRPPLLRFERNSFLRKKYPVSNSRPMEMD